MRILSTFALILVLCICVVRLSPVPRIVNGQTAAAGAYPWFAAIFNSRNQIFCGASLISNTYLLTAAHCFVKDDGTPVSITGMYVRINTVNIADGSGIVRPLLSAIPHPQYNPNTVENDLCILRISNVTGVPFANLITQEQNGFECPCTSTMAIGFGATSTTGRAVANLQQAVLPVAPSAYCVSIYASQSIDINLTDMICAGDLKNLRDTCFGDSGGPLFVSTGAQQATLVGLTSFAVADCGTSVYPGVYSRVSSYLPGILGFIQNGATTWNTAASSFVGPTQCEPCNYLPGSGSAVASVAPWSMVLVVLAFFTLLY